MRVDVEIDILRDRLTGEVAAETMPTAVAAQVTLLARFYERLGDHAVNLAVVNCRVATAAQLIHGRRGAGPMERLAREI